MEFSIISLLKLIKFKYKLFFGIILVITGISITFAFIAPKEYQADCSIMPPDDSQGGSNLSGFLQNISGGLSLGGVSQNNKSQILTEILKSKNLSKFIIDSLNLKSNSKFSSFTEQELVSYIQKTLDINAKKSGLITISSNISTNYFSSTEENLQTAKLAAEIANKSIEGLDYFSKNKIISKARRKRIFIEEILVDKMKLLDSIDKNLELFRTKNKAFEIEEQAKAVLNNAIGIGSDLAKAEIELKLKQQEFDSNSGNLDFYQKKVNKLKEQYNNVQSGGIVDKDEFSIPLKDIPSLIRQYTNLVREQKILEQVKLYLETQKYQETIQENSDIPTIEVLDKAVIPEKQNAPVKSLILLVSFLLSTIIATIILLVGAIKSDLIYFKRVN